MKFKFILFLLSFLLGSVNVIAQTEKEYTFVFHPVFGNSKLVLGDSLYKLNNGDTISIDALRFYISGIQLMENNRIVWSEKNSFHLIDAAVDKSLSVSFKAPAEIQFHEIKFNLGIDSLTNVSGAMGADLDPTKGMYWTWQSGYINFKLEGRSKKCKTRNNEFQFHLGGYQFPFNDLKTIVLEVQGNEKTDITIDIGKMLNEIDLARENQIMSPGKDAVLLSEKAKKIFIVR